MGLVWFALLGDVRSKLDAREAFIPGLIEAAPDITLAEIGERSVRFGRSSTGAASRSNKTAHAAEQRCPDVRRRRTAWFDGHLDPERSVFINGEADKRKRPAAALRIWG